MATDPELKMRLIKAAESKSYVIKRAPETDRPPTL
jgi:hypothetical protein